MIAAVVALMLLAPGCYQQPVSSPVVDPFRAPTCSFCPGNRGLEYRPSPGSTVAAAAAGVVRFSGVVAGVRYLVVEQADGRTATYGRLAVSLIAVGSSVSPGQPVATTTDRFYFGLREGERYIDPSPFLGVLRYRPRLIPTDGAAPRHPPPPTLRCSASRVGERAPRR